MMYKNPLEARLAELNRELAIAIMNDWEFDIAILEDEIAYVEELLLEEDL